MIRNLALAGVAALGLAQPAAAISVDVVGAPATVTAGDFFGVDIVISGIVDEIITAWDIDVAFDPALLQNTSQTWYLAAMGGADVLTGGQFLVGVRTCGSCRCSPTPTSARCSARAASAPRP
jgi:hypothetical protein